mgnify:CR=1 FL=1
MLILKTKKSANISKKFKLKLIFVLNCKTKYEYEFEYMNNPDAQIIDLSIKYCHLKLVNSRKVFQEHRPISKKGRFTLHRNKTKNIFSTR